MPKTKHKATSRAFELAFLEDVYRRDTSDTRALEMLATLYTELGMIAQGLLLDRRHIELEPTNPSAHYNCACSLALSGQNDEAFEKLHIALELGFENIEWMHEDPDLAPLRSDSRWELLPKA